MRALLTHAWPSLLATLLVAALAGCHDEKAIETPVSKTTPTVATLVSKSCSATQPRVFAARPFGNKTKAAVELGGTEDLVMTAMTESGCYKVAERDQVDILIEEMKRCSDDNPDKQYFKCDDFAKKGKLMGVTHFVFGDLILYEPKIKGAELGAKIPGLGGLEVGRTYGALQVSMRLVEVETGKVVTSKVVNAIVKDDEGGIDASAHGFSLKAKAYEKTPAGNALRDMIASAIQHFAATKL